MAKQCLFCDNVADTKEHLWSDWILQGLKRTHPIRQVIQKSDPKEFYGDVRIKCVCSTCNSGWMSDLENSVRSVVGAMVHDISVTIDVETQRAISRWITKTSMVLEAAIPVEKRFYTRDDCRQLRLDGTIPERSMIWLGRMSEIGVFAAGTRVWLIFDDSETRADGVVATFSVGNLASQILTFRFADHLNSTTMHVQCFDGPWEESLITIHPNARPVSWPQKLTFSLNGTLPFTRLRDRWKVGRAL
ncbi:MAG: hypothetical protein WAM98_05555 [Terriglobales bacterium]